MEWWLLTREERAMRAFSTAVVAIVTGYGYAMLGMVSMFVLAGLVGVIPANMSIDPQNPIILAALAVFGAALAAWFFVAWLAYDKRRSSERLSDPEYIDNLISSRIATQNDLARAAAEGNRSLRSNAKQT